jgi:hypothetical protein
VQVSTINKVNEALTVTINSIEAISSHCNEATPRRNGFWASMTRIAKIINRGIEYYPDSVRHNFNTATRRAAGFVHIIGERQMNRQKEFYCTNTEEATCNCGVCSYLSKMFKCFVPYRHLLHSGLTKLTLLTPPSLIRSPEPGFELV